MTREKLLWGLSGTLAVIAAVLAVLLMLQLSPAGKPGDETPNAGEPPGAAEPDAEAGAGGLDGEGRVVAQAGGVELGEAEFIDGLKRAYGDEFVRQWLLHTVVRLEAQEIGIAVDRTDIDAELERMQVGYDSEAEFFRVMKEQLGMTEQDLRDDALHRLLLEGIATRGVEVTEADVEAYIQENPEQFAPRRDVRYAQIVSETSEQAWKVLEELRAGADFAMLARDVSLDEATAEAGGDSGWVPADDPFIPEEIASALAAMETGDVSEPIALSDGHWAIVTLLGRRTIDPLDDSRVREELKRELALAQAPSLFDVETALLEKYNAVDFLPDD